MIGPHDRISTVLARDESLIDVFVSLSPAFERLRNVGMRKVMSRLVTVEQAARMAGVDPDILVSSINAHLAEPDVTAAGAPAATAASGMGSDDAHAPAVSTDGEVDPGAGGGHGVPDELASIPDERRLEIDVRQELRAGNEPFSQIMAALRDVPAGGAFAVRAIFEPVPLYAVMRRHGLANYTQRLGDEDWRVWFYPSGSVQRMESGAGVAPATAGAPSGGAGEVPPAAADPSTAMEDGVLVLDVRNMEPPEPMMHTLAALETLPSGGTLVQLNVRVPQFLLPLLDERGFTYDIREQSPELVRVFIRHRTA